MTDCDDRHVVLVFTAHPPATPDEANAFLSARLPELAVRAREIGVLSTTQGIALSLLRCDADNWRQGMPTWMVDQGEAHLRDHPDEQPVVIVIEPAPRLRTS